MSSFSPKDNSKQGALALDEFDALKKFRSEFSIPKAHTGQNQLYFAGHSLGLMPKRTRQIINEELEAWESFGVEGHFHAKHPWLPYHENITQSFARLVGAQENEVVAMNSLTANLHLMLVSFYRPTAKKYKILIEHNTFPSDKYAVDSQARFHGFNSQDAVIELKPKSGQLPISTDDILEQIEANKDSLALVMLGNCNYLSGQRFDFDKITRKAHEVGAFCGFNLAHGAGNLLMRLHDWNVDFAVWCSYKYLNSGPGGIAGCFIHANHLGQKNIPRFEGWWGHNKDSRFKMGPNFDPLPTVEAWQLSNPPIFQLAALRSSMQLFDEAGIANLRIKGDQLTAYLEWLMEQKVPGKMQVVTPKDRGSMLCVRVQQDPKRLLGLLKEKEVILDFREPDILRITPVPLYNSFSDVYELTEIFAEALHE